MASITKERLSARRAEYVADKEQLLASLHALSGAVQDIDFWLAELEKEEKEDGLQLRGESADASLPRPS